MYCVFLFYFLYFFFNMGGDLYLGPNFSPNLASKKIYNYSSLNYNRASELLKTALTIRMTNLHFPLQSKQSANFLNETPTNNTSILSCLLQGMHHHTRIFSVLVSFNILFDFGSSKFSVLNFSSCYFTKVNILSFKRFF
jgi:hypothetical protein